MKFWKIAASWMEKQQFAGLHLMGGSILIRGGIFSSGCYKTEGNQSSWNYIKKAVMLPVSVDWTEIKQIFILTALEAIYWVLYLGSLMLLSFAEAWAIWQRGKLNCHLFPFQVSLVRKKWRNSLCCIFFQGGYIGEFHAVCLSCQAIVSLCVQVWN